MAAGREMKTNCYPWRRWRTTGEPVAPISFADSLRERRDL